MSYDRNASYEDSLQRLLSDMGRSSIEVADVLRRKGIKGVPGRASECPITRYLRESMPMHLTIDVYSRQASARLGHAGEIVAWVDLPPAVLAFIDIFDGPASPWPDLVDNSRPAVSYDPNEVVSREDIAREHGAPWPS